MKLALLLLCHKNPEQINLLLDVMQHPDIDFFIHVDKKSTINNKINLNEHVYMLDDTERINVEWAGFSQVEATYKLLLLAHNTGTYDYYWLCSGQDFPVKSVNRIMSFFEKEGKLNNYIRYFESRNYKSFKSNNYDKRNDVFYPAIFMGKGTIKRLLRRGYVFVTGGYNNTYSLFRRHLRNVDFYYGSQWWCINNETLEWILDYIICHPEFVDYYRNCSTPDESFFHTLVMNSPFALQSRDYLHYIDWSENENSPKILNKSDVCEANQSQFLMARKFDISIDRSAIEAAYKISKSM